MGAVGRRRKHDRHLPQRVYLRHGAHYYVAHDGNWLPLGKDYSEALQALSVILASGLPVTTVADLVARYEIEELSRHAARTQRNRKQQFKMLLKVFGPMRPQTIQSHHVWNYWTKGGRRVQTRKEIAALSTLLTFARRIGAMKKPNPCFGLQLPTVPPRDRYVTDEEFLLVRSVAQPMIAYAMDIAYTTGMDQGTIRSLEWRNLTEEGFVFERGKTGVAQVIVIGDDLRERLRELRRERPELRRFLICNRRGQPYSLNGFQSQWRRALTRAKKAGLVETFHFHDLRAKSGSDSESDQAAADRLGHSDPSLTRRVYRRLPRRATALKILDTTKNIGQ